MPQLLLSLCDIKVSAQHSDTLVGRNLTTGVGLAIHDPEARVGGMLTSLLPEPAQREQAEESPLLFLSTSLPLLVEELEKIGADRERMVIKAAGCSTMMGTPPVFDNGKRNIEQLRQRLRDMALNLAAEDLGGTVTRTLSLNIGTGTVMVRKRAEELEI